MPINFRGLGNITTILGSTFEFLVGAPASGSLPGKDKIAVQSALSQASSIGGVIRFGPGTYDVGDLDISLPAYSSGIQISLRGAGREATHLVFSVNRGTGTYAIHGTEVRETDSYLCVISDMRIVGPVTRPSTIGTWPANSMSGIRWDRGMTIERCDIAGFYAAVESDANHSDIRNCTIGDNYYGIYFTTATYGGDITIDTCDLGGNLFASIAISPTGLATFMMIKGHIGFSPYGVYIENGAGAGLSLGGSFFLGTSWEFLGNGAIFSEGQTGRVDGLVLMGCGVFTNNNAAYKISGINYLAHIYVSTFDNVSLSDTNILGTTSITSAFIDVSTDLQNLEWRTFLASYQAAIGASIPFIKGLASALTRNVVLSQGQSLTAFAAPCSQFFPIVAGSIVERRDLATIQPYASQGGTSKGQIAGVALNAVAALSREYVIVATKGHNLTILCDAAIGVTDVLVPSTANPTKVIGIQSDGTTTTLTKPVLGRAYLASVGPGTIQADLNIANG